MRKVIFAAVMITGMNTFGQKEAYKVSEVQSVTLEDHSSKTINDEISFEVPSVEKYKANRIDIHRSKKRGRRNRKG